MPSVWIIKLFVLYLSYKCSFKNYYRINLLRMTKLTKEVNLNI